MKKNLSIKILVVFIAVILWIQQVFLKEHLNKINIPVIFEELPKNLVIQENEFLEIPVTIQARGMDFLILKLSKSFFQINAFNYKYGINDLNITKQELVLPSRIKIAITSIHLDKKTIFVDKFITRQIPLDVQFASAKDEEFFLQNKIIDKSQKIEIRGPEKLINKLKKIKTKEISRKMVKDEKLTIGFQNPDEKLQIIDKDVTFTISQTRIVTKTISLIPIKYPLNQNITIIPQKVSAMVKGPENIVSKMNNKNVIARIDEHKIRKNDFAKVKFELPSGVSLIEYTPQRIQVVTN
ncbi:MAG: hypothetical protein H8E57_04390 [Candidatus Cloacimonetes bacterium]|nr:hypothetical protein [Candidatus Cloacimonadota bacterium]